MKNSFAYLGPKGTFTEAAFLQMPIGQGADLIPAESVREALNLVRAGKVFGALVPIENSVEGSVATTLDELGHGDSLEIIDEIAIPVEFALLAKPGISISDIKRIATHPHAHAQCVDWLHTNTPGVHVLPAMSTAAAAEELSQGANYDAAICSVAAAKHYGLEILAQGIGDSDSAWTRFVLVSKPGHAQPATGNDKTTLSLFMHRNQPGALLNILTEFAVRGIDLSRLESRPTKQQLGDYFFSLDCVGHIDDQNLGDTLIELRKICADVKFLGSYPRHDNASANGDIADVAKSKVDPETWLENLRKRND
jgi:prephenate dehydratase